MLALRELQHRFADAIFAREPARFAMRVRRHRLPGAACFQVYQNNVFISLTQALADVYPVIARLVGEEFFAFAARGFVRAHPSRSGNLHEFGRALASHLRDLPAAAALPYLADVAALEWACHEVFHAGEAGALDPVRLAAVPAAAHEHLRLRLHPATRLVASRYPVLAIWAANQDDAAPDTVVDLAAGPDHLLVARREFARTIERIAPGEHALLAACAEGATLAAACDAALVAQADLDIAAVVGRFVADRAIVGFDHS